MWFDPRETAKTNDAPAATLATLATFQAKQIAEPEKIAEFAKVAPTQEAKNEANDDDRRHCSTCQNFDGKRCRARNVLVIDWPPRRCVDYRPIADDADQRTGRERWPSMRQSLEVCNDTQA